MTVTVFKFLILISADFDDFIFSLFSLVLIEENEEEQEQMARALTKQNDQSIDAMVALCNPCARAE